MVPDSYSKHQKVLLLLIVVTIVSSVALCFVQAKEWKSVKEQADELAKDLGNPEKLREEVSEIRNATVSSRLAVAHLELNLPTRDYVPTMLRELEIMGRTAGLRITGVRPIEKKEKPKPTAEEDAAKPGAPKTSEKREERKPYEEMDFQIQASGYFMQGLEFLQKLDSFPKIIEVRSVSINATPNPRDVGPVKLTFDFEIRAYIFPAKPQSLASSRIREENPEPATRSLQDGG